MPIEGAMLQVARPKMGGGPPPGLIEREGRKGCLPNISSQPVQAEPPYNSIHDGPDEASIALFVPINPPSPEELRCYTVWRPREFPGDWVRAERLLKAVNCLEGHLLFEVRGNSRGISLSFICAEVDSPLLTGAFQGEYPECELGLVDHLPDERFEQLIWERVQVREFYPRPPYSHLFTRPTELKHSPLVSFMNVLSKLDDSHLGIFQAILAPVNPANNWSENIATLIDHEYQEKLLAGSRPYYRAAQQSPSGDLHGMAHETDLKSHNDKPILAAVIRVATVPMEPNASLIDIRGLSAFTSLVQHGSRSLEHVTEQDFRERLTPSQVRDMITLGRIHRSGSIMNSAELSTFVNLPPVDNSSRNCNQDILELRSASSRNIEDGTLIGFESHAGIQCPLLLSTEERLLHAHLFGRSGKGKSVLMENMCVQDIAQGSGIALIDPHEDLAQALLGQIPESRIQDVVFFNPSDTEWIMKWNLLRCVEHSDPSYIAEIIIDALRDVSIGWGDRLERALLGCLLGLLRVPDATLADVYAVMNSVKDPPRNLRNKVLSATSNPIVRDFWKHELATYRRDETRVVINKLSKLFSSDPLCWMFSQPENALDFRRIMDEGKIFIADLSGCGPETQATLGSVLSRMFFLAAKGRSDERRPFYLYIDEAASFSVGPMKATLEEARKFGVGLTLAHQNLSQFRSEEVVSLVSSGVEIVFTCINQEAQRIQSLLGGELAVEELTGLRRAETLVRIDDEWSKVRIPKPSEGFSAETRARVIEASRQQNCLHVDVVKNRVLGRQNFPTIHASKAIEGETEADYRYDRLFSK